MQFRIFGFSEAHNSALYYGNFLKKIAKRSCQSHLDLLQNCPYFLLISTQVLSSVWSKTLCAGICHTHWTVFLGDIAIRPVTSSHSPSFSCFSRSTIVHHSQTKMAKFYLIPSLIFIGCSPMGYFLLQRERNYFSLCVHVKDLESLYECKKNCHACVR